MNITLCLDFNKLTFSSGTAGGALKAVRPRNIIRLTRLLFLEDIFQTFCTVTKLTALSQKMIFSSPTTK